MVNRNVIFPCYNASNLWWLSYLILFYLHTLTLLQTTMIWQWLMKKACAKKVCIYTNIIDVYIHYQSLTYILSIFNFVLLSAQCSRSLCYSQSCSRKLSWFAPRRYVFTLILLLSISTINHWRISYLFLILCY
jgi:hypothetical protein